MAEDLSQTDSQKQNYNLRIIVFGLFFGGLFLLSVGAGLFFFKSDSSHGDIQIIGATESARGGGAAGEIVVHIDGAVVAPGVYRLPQDSRIYEAISKAQGLTAEAETARINLAARIADGQKIHIPSLAEASEGKTSFQSRTTGLVNINTASQVELDSLPGVGLATAQKIIASRPYSTLEDLLSKKAVSTAVFEKIRELITVY